LNNLEVSDAWALRLAIPEGHREVPTDEVTDVQAISARDSSLGGVPREEKMLEGHLPRVIYHQVY